MNMIEKIARAMHDKSVALGAQVPKNYNDVPKKHKDHFIAVIRAGIEAMREPTNDMANEYFKIRKDVGDINATACFNVSVWECSIDAALKESVKE